MKRFTVVVLAFAMVPQLIALEDTVVTYADLLSLCTLDEKIGVSVYFVASTEAAAEAAAEAGLTQARIGEMAERRLRAAQLYRPPDKGDYLDIRVDLLQPRFLSAQAPGASKVFVASPVLRYSKRLLDPNIGVINAHTYQDGELLIGSPELILLDISEAIDEFVSYYLRVRDSASCADHRKFQDLKEAES